MEILRILNSDRYTGHWIIPILLLMAISIVSCSKKPAQYYDLGMNAFKAGQYAKAQEDFADGIRKGGNTNLYAGFIAANLVTGKYPEVNSAYNGLCDHIHSSLEQMYGPRLISVIGISSKLIPYSTKGGNKIPSDFPETIALQSNVDYQGYLAVKQQIENAIKK